MWASLFVLLFATGGCAARSAAATSTSTSIPAWMQLRVGASARLGYYDERDPEQAYVFKSAAAARSSIGSTDFRPAGALVTVTAIEPGSDTPTGQVVQVTGAGWSGWLTSDDLRPIPPPGSIFDVRALAKGQQQMLYAEQDDDDGTPFGTDSHVTYLDFSNNPGNPEYQVRVNDGPLAGTIGYVMADELIEPPSHRFAMVAP